MPFHDREHVLMTAAIPEPLPEFLITTDDTPSEADAEQLRDDVQITRRAAPRNVPETCGDLRVELNVVYTCTLDQGHIGLHCGPDPGPVMPHGVNHEWPHDHCAAPVTTPQGHFACVLPAHPGGGAHRAITASGASYCWYAPGPGDAEVNIARLGAFAPNVADFLDSVTTVEARDRVIPMGPPFPHDTPKCGAHRITLDAHTFTCELDQAHSGPHEQPTTMTRMGHRWEGDNCGTYINEPRSGTDVVCALEKGHGRVLTPNGRYSWTSVGQDDPPGPPPPFHLEAHPAFPGVVVPMLDQEVRMDPATGAGVPLHPDTPQETTMTDAIPPRCEATFVGFAGTRYRCALDADKHEPSPSTEDGLRHEWMVVEDAQQGDPEPVAPVCGAPVGDTHPDHPPCDRPPHGDDMPHGNGLGTWWTPEASGPADIIDGIGDLAVHEAPDWHAELDRVLAESNAQLARAARDRAVEHAVRALAPTGPESFRPGPDDEGLSALDLYAAGVVKLAERFADYIQNGA
jgi:hypothetical protein